MKNVYYIIGKSGTGKNTIYEQLREKYPQFTPMVQYTTRPKREGEEEGKEYHFVSKSGFAFLVHAGTTITSRSYNTKQGIWRYATVDPEKFTNATLEDSCIAIGSLSFFKEVRDYYGADKVIPIYLEVEENLRFERLVAREQSQKNCDYRELCRRYESDCMAFTEKRLKQAGISRVFKNTELSKCVEEICQMIDEIEKK